MGKAELIGMLNKALEFEHAARVQYLSHAKIAAGRDSEPIVKRLEEIAGDEEKHEGLFRDCLEILDATPSMGIEKVYSANGTDEILKVNLKGEKEAVDFYRKIVEELKKSRDELPYEYEFIEHKVRHVIMDEEEHILEIKNIL
ncbi:hypothetical protein COV61_05630 [Candidatus Micrarchaeota archaeon CG11_big_fil_rev_8_21_14_0_20_47_5]|nr:MAG: hypothetical protein AUJ17_00860 [Candidatus Micrarchaeota archaeon CG1_02_47_40]PIN82562.1 MAG: hypothetical protein COV61_05630 [Candidatus Micrarchaeota archaeon CG11_big_fil_rev_8_21_14_0_20_47_5]